ncbi:hypothetical protein [Crossiella cryophila]|uniref:Nuclear transport factor 2 family protein n=1 Tax=Crossiella cryophila TaxID=43355 RepID=A0A7W7C730_9PSEU|nr:hypothetical protein [Crossiella cryophila]MBB4674433.1 hypothetical protein [Crossiella cryophila]
MPVLLPLLLASGCVQIVSGPEEAGTGESQPTASPQVVSPGGVVRTSDNPREVIRVVYASVANEDTRLACTMFSPEAGKAFAANFGKADCPEAITHLAKQVTDKIRYKNIQVDEQAVLASGGKSTAFSCALAVTTGPRLGEFALERSPDGWLVTGHRTEPADCSPS